MQARYSRPDSGWRCGFVELPGIVAILWALAAAVLAGLVVASTLAVPLLLGKRPWHPPYRGVLVAAVLTGAGALAFAVDVELGWLPGMLSIPSWDHSAWYDTAMPFVLAGDVAVAAVVGWIANRLRDSKRVHVSGPNDAR